MVLAFVPLILLGLAALMALVIFLQGGSLGVSQGALASAIKGDVSGAVKGHVREKTRRVMVKESNSDGLKGKILRKVFAALAKLQKFQTKLKILISLWQILQGMGPVFAIPFPPFYESAVSSVGGLLQIELPQLMPLDCIVHTSYYSRLIFKCTWPLVAYALVGLLARKLGNMGEKRASQADSLINFAFFLMFILYPSISSSLFSMFYCVDLEDGTSWLRVDLTLECSTDAYRAMMAFTFVMLGLHTVGTPCLLYTSPSPRDRQKSRMPSSA